MSTVKSTVSEMKGLSIRARLTLWNSGLLVVALLVLACVLNWIARTVVMESVDRELVARANLVRESWASRLDEGSVSQFPPAADVALRPRIVLASNTTIRSDMLPANLSTGVHRQPRRASRAFNRFMERFFTPDGLPMLPAGQLAPWDPHTFSLSAMGNVEYSTVTFEREPFRVYSAPVRSRGQIVGILQVAEPMAEIERGLGGLTSALMIMAPMALLISGFGGAVLTGRTLRPINQITHTAERIGATNLSERLPACGGDEFSSLSRTMNGMLDRLERSFGLLERSCEQQRRFTADVSHELRTPLTVIIGNSSMALSKQCSPEEQRRALTACNQAATQMSHMIHDLLLLARADSGQMNLQLEPIPITNVLETAIELFRCREQAPIVMEGLDPELSIVGDHWSLVRLFTNLIENAARYTPLTGLIQIRVTNVSSKIFVTVEDTGPGIQAQYLAHLFERFYRADRARSRSEGGSGLGLSICKSIVEAHVGSIHIESAVGVGTKVIVTLVKATDT